MGKEIVNQVQEAQRVPGKINPRKNTLRHIVIKMTNINNIQGDLIRLSADFSTETLQVRRERHSIFKVMEGKNL